MIKLLNNILLSVFITLFISATPTLFSQSIWTELSPMPMPITNNAVTQAMVEDTLYVYSFGGLDSTKHWTGITQASMRYNTVSDQWSFIPDLPDTLGKIASAASTVDNIIYITGGYHVIESSPFELSSNKIHRFDPATNSYLTDGAPMPHPIDDHVQAVWRDSLIYVVTGWSNSSNVPYVQIYNPSLDVWLEASSTPNNAQYTAFGASGVIIGDTIFYNGGAAGFSFGATAKMRRGIINPEDPTSIEWELLEDNPGDKGYRMAAVAIGDKAFWIGGSGISYNYDGIAYNGSGGVPPLQRILSYDTSTDFWYPEWNQAYGVMDLRGAAQIGDHSFIICGGMMAGQQVSDRTFLITIDAAAGIEERMDVSRLKLYPNPAPRNSEVILSYAGSHPLWPLDHIEMYNASGHLVKERPISQCKVESIRIATDGLASGTYSIVGVHKGKVVWTTRLFIQ